MNNMQSLTANQMKDIERESRETYGISEVIMMENASIAIAHAASELMSESGMQKIYIFCGTGNNGGDGLACARHLFNKGYSVTIILSKPMDEYKNISGSHLYTAQKIGLPISVNEAEKDIPRNALIIDALLGTGITGQVAGPCNDLINLINKSNAGVLSVDIPSGLHADTGKPLGNAVKADTTITMCAPKTGMLTREAKQFTGNIIIGDIGIPIKLLVTR